MQTSHTTASQRRSKKAANFQCERGLASLFLQDRSFETYTVPAHLPGCLQVIRTQSPVSSDVEWSNSISFVGPLSSSDSVDPQIRFEITDGNIFLHGSVRNIWLHWRLSTNIIPAMTSTGFLPPPDCRPIARAFSLALATAQASFVYIPTTLEAMMQ